MKTRIQFTIILAALLSAVSLVDTTDLYAQPTLSDGVRIVGRVVDSSTGEPLLSATIYVEETEQGAVTDLDGYFSIGNVEPGLYTLRVSYVSYATKVITDVEVESGQTLRLEVDLQQATSEMDEVIVSARVMRNNEASLLSLRQKSMVVSNAISAEHISRSGSSNAADAMEKVSGASVLDGKYVYVRGLGDRYMNTNMNGSKIPSSDPDKNAVPFDLFPSSLLENITTTKSFTPDLPGDFTGGSVNIQTKDYPDRFEIKLSASSGFNTAVGAGGDMLLYDGGRTGIFGNPGSNRQIPEAVLSANNIPPLSSSFTNEENALELDRLTKSFSSVMAPREIKAPFDQSFSASAGNQFDLFGKPLGIMAAFSQSKDISGYTDGESARYQLTSNAATTEGLSNQFLLNDQYGKEEVLWGGMVNLAYSPLRNHKVGVNYMYSKNVESSARFLSGPFTRDLPEDGIFETRVLKYTERSLNSVQLKGEHQLFGERNGIRVEWNANRSTTEQNEPDLRFFTNDVLTRQRSNGDFDTTYQVSTSIYPRPTRYFRDLQEENRSLDAFVEIPLDNVTNTRTRVKFGGSLSEKEREFNDREFQLAQDRFNYTGDPNQFFAPENLGIDEERSNESFFRFNHYLIDNTQRRNSYSGNQTVQAAFGMAEMTLFDRLRVSGGVRLETTEINVASADTALTAGRIDEKDLLPSVSIVYELFDNINLRLAYGKTLARPTFREMAPFASFDFVNSNIVVGNPSLQRTLVQNYDFRFEWFPRPGELYAISLFMKDFDKPIEKVFNPIAAASNPEIQFRNVGEARVYGVEFELRKQLDQLSGIFQNFDVGLNLTFVHSEVSIADDELQLIRALNPGSGSKRPLQGQSPYVVNTDITYSNPSIGTVMSLFYNVFGPRMSEVSVGGTPNVFEYSRNQLDFIAEQRIFGEMKINASVKNILNEEFRKGHEFKGNDFFVQRYQLGRSLSLGVSYSF
ncbi:TonB-dependent receptor [Rhodohalobacter sp. SW132]|uniref:TonB-dependent receptor n=1 Tax=Rhodohalobacter sp. SW132 TaxID=2293433 RepID=UPI000E2397E8|nr:TonB-dependent receptor [Rhodohalobacter sp. SW132]REL33569.1 TonB-dependent receptor [Rhodohalobacter sp. SW132]